MRLAQVLVEQLPGFVRSALLYASLDPRRLAQHIHTVEDAEELRKVRSPRTPDAHLAL